MSTRWFAAASLLLILGAAEATYLAAEHYAVGGYGFSLDDSWIHAVFARNLASGNGCCFNPQEEIAGSTAPLFTVLLAGWYLIAHEVIWGAKLLGMLGLALAGLFLYLAGERLANRATAWLAVALCFVSPALLIANLSGMEIGLYLVSPCAALYAWSRQKYGWMITALGLGVWLRPEALLLLAVGWLAVPKERRWVMLGIGTAFVLPYFVFNYTLSGFPLPLTVLTKSRKYTGHFSLVYLQETQYLFSTYHWLPLFALLPVGFVALFKKAWWAAVYPPLFYLTQWGMQLTSASFHRYLHPMLPFAYLTMAFSLVWLAGRPPKWRSAAWVVLAVLLIMQARTAYHLRWTHALAVQNITDMQVTMGKMAAEVTAPADTIATCDVGAIGYFSGRYVLDLIGLVTPMQSFSQNMRERPAMLAIFDPWFAERRYDSTFVDHYKYLAALKLNQNIVCGYETMSIYVRDDRYDDIAVRFQELQMNSP
jgi:hypothetical protein